MKKILIVDNEPKLRRLVTVMLPGYVVLEANDGDEALDVVRREHLLLVLLDIQMPGIDGIEVCRRIKADESLRDIIVVILTAQAREAGRQRATEAGADNFLTKPFSPSQVVDMVRHRIG